MIEVDSVAPPVKTVYIFPYEHIGGTVDNVE